MANLELICGPMFSGKSEEFIRRIRRLSIAGKKVLVFKPSMDNRYDSQKIVSHNGAAIDAITTATDISGVEKISSEVKKAGKVDFICIDEIQFFDDTVTNIIEDFLKKDVNVIVAGLDKDFRGEPFGPMARLMAICDYVTKLDAVCLKCGKSATMTQRIIDGKPAKYNDPIKLVGERDKYEARCRKCFEIRR